MMNRRDVLNLAVSTGAVAALPRTPAQANADSSKRRIVDTNVSLFQWPFRRLPLDEPSALVARYRSLGIDQAWAGSFEALLHRDITGVNLRLAEACRDFPELVPVGSVNPTLTGWESDLQDCIGELQMSVIRLYPNYHGYTLDAPQFGDLLNLATKSDVLVQLAVAMEDKRTQHQLVHVNDVDLAPLRHILAAVPRARVQILNHRGPASVLSPLSQLPGVFFDTARADGTAGVPQLLQQVGSDRVLFGSHAPFLIPEAALIRVHETSSLDSSALTSVLSRNADRQLKKSAV